MVAWASRPNVRKGDYAEDIVDDWFHEQGYQSYIPASDGTPHLIDRVYFDPFCLNGPANPRAFFVEIKSKARRNKYPDTGIDVYAYWRYMRLLKTLSGRQELCLLFVDHECECIYGNSLRELSLPYVEDGRVYPWVQGNIVYFPLSKMRHVKDLTPCEVETLRELAKNTHSKRR